MEGWRRGGGRSLEGRAGEKEQGGGGRNSRRSRWREGARERGRTAPILGELPVLKQTRLAAARKQCTTSPIYEVVIAGGLVARVDDNQERMNPLSLSRSDEGVVGLVGANDAQSTSHEHEKHRGIGATSLSERDAVGQTRAEMAEEYGSHGSLVGRKFGWRRLIGPRSCRAEPHCLPCCLLTCTSARGKQGFGRRRAPRISENGLAKCLHRKRSSADA